MLNIRRLCTASIFLSLVATGKAQAPQAPPSCDPAGDIRFVCGQAGPEDLVAVPRTAWLVASAITGDGGLYLVDTAKGTSTRIFPAAAAAERFDRNVDGARPGPPAGEDHTMFRPHGLYLKAGRQSVHTVYAVHHGGRESVEVFELNA